MARSKETRERLITRLGTILQAYGLLVSEMREAEMLKTTGKHSAKNIRRRVNSAARRYNSLHSRLSKETAADLLDFPENLGITIPE